MLGKLLKHEWESSWKIPVLLICILIGLSLVTGCAFKLPIWESDWIGIPISGFMMVMTFYAGIIAAPIGVSIYMAVRFYKSMFTDEGYLTHTLPVTHHELLLSKIIIMVVWQMISALATLVAIVLFGGIFVSSFAGNEVWKELVSTIAEAQWAILSQEEFGGWELFGAVGIVSIIASALQTTMCIVASICLGQMLGNHRILGAIASYMAIGMALGIVNSFISLLTMAYAIRINASSFFAAYTPTYAITSVLYLGASVGFYFLSAYLIRRQLNLE